MATAYNLLTAAAYCLMLPDHDAVIAAAAAGGARPNALNVDGVRVAALAEERHNKIEGWHALQRRHALERHLSKCVNPRPMTKTSI